MRQLVSKLLFPLLFPAFLLAQPNSGLDGTNVIINADKAVEICSGTGGISLAVGCTGGGTTYKHTFGTDGSLTLPGTLTVDTISSVNEVTFNGTGNDILFNTDDLTIAATTSDGSDTLGVAISAGATATNTRGAYLRLYGNEDSPAGAVQIVTGNIATSDIDLTAQDVVRLNPGGSTVATFSSTGMALPNNIFVYGNEAGGVSKRLIGFNSSDDLQIGEANGAYDDTQIYTGDEVQILYGSGSNYMIIDESSMRGSPSIALGASGLPFLSIILRSPDGSSSSCTVDNSDNLTCTGL